MNLTSDQLNALEKARRHFGRCWKAELSACWARSSYPVELREVDTALQRIRNTIGPSGLMRLKLK